LSPSPSWPCLGHALALTPMLRATPSREQRPGQRSGQQSRLRSQRFWPSRRPPPETPRLLEASRPRPRQAPALTPANLARWQPWQWRSRWWWSDPLPTGGQLQGTTARTPRLPQQWPPRLGPRRAASPAGSTPHGVLAPREHASDPMTRGSAANEVKISGAPREDQRIKDVTFKRENSPRSQGG
jgi:hypothetical protein